VDSFVKREGRGGKKRETPIGGKNNRREKMLQRKMRPTALASNDEAEDCVFCFAVSASSDTEILISTS